MEIFLAFPFLLKALQNDKICRGNTKKKENKNIDWMPVGQTRWHGPSSHVGEMYNVMSPNHVCTRILFKVTTLFSNLPLHILSLFPLEHKNTPSKKTLYAQEIT